MTHLNELDCRHEDDWGDKETDAAHELEQEIRNLLREHTDLIHVDSGVRLRRIPDGAIRQESLRFTAANGQDGDITRIQWPGTEVNPFELTVDFYIGEFGLRMQYVFAADGRVDVVVEHFGGTRELTTATLISRASAHQLQRIRELLSGATFEEQNAM